MFFLLLALALLATASAQQSVTITFDGVVGNAPIACGQDYPDVGSGDTTITFQDARMYVSNLRLINAAGRETPINLEQNRWQYQNVALLDFEAATAGCSDVGTKATHNEVKGTVPEGTYSGLVFDLGVPFELNHADATTAPSPLNVSSLFWSWQGGYKFVRTELLGSGAKTARAEPATQMSGAAPAPSGMAMGYGGMDMGDMGGAANGFWPIHLGSTGCSSPAPVISPATECARPNLSTVHLESFNPASDAVKLDVAGLLKGVNVGKSLELAPPGCMSGFDDPDCCNLFGNFGLALKTGQATASQSLFSVTGGGARAGR